MKIAVIGTGMVGQNIAATLNRLGHHVSIATRDKLETEKRDQLNQMTGTSFMSWLNENHAIQLVNFSDVDSKTELFVNATGGQVSIRALNLVGEDIMNGKVLLDISNPLDFSKGFPPTLTLCNDDSLGESIQREFPSVKVVKSLNTMTTAVMTNPGLVEGNHNVFVNGNHEDAKQLVVDLLQDIGWKTENIIDLGDISCSRGAEMILPMWLRLWNKAGHATFNFHIAGI